MATQRRMNRMNVIAWTTAAGASVFAASVSANQYGFYNSDHDQLWGRTQIPDFDQRRQGVIPFFGFPNNGVMYCVPASTMNNLAYIAAHGYPEITPGLGNWQSQADYNPAGFEIQDLAVAMGTNPTGGTSTQGWFDGTQSVLDWRFLVMQRLASGLQPTTGDRAAHMGQLGGLLQLCWGNWEVNGTVLGSRDGGHCVTLARVETTGSTSYELRMRDPDDSGVMNTQSAFTYRIVDVEDRAYLNGITPLVAMEMDTIDTDAGPRTRILDKIYAIFALQGMTVDPAGGINVATPNLVNPGNPTHQGLSPSLPIACAAFSPDLTHVAAVTQLDALRVINRLSGVEQPVAVNLTEPKDIMYGRDGHIFVLDGDDVVKINPNESVPEVGRFSLPAGAGAVGFDIVDAPTLPADRLILNWGGENDLIVGELMTDLSRLTETPVDPDSGYNGDDVTAVRVDRDGNPWLAAGDTLVRLVLGGAGSYQSVVATLPGTINDLSVMDDGRVLVATSAGVRGYEYDASTGQINGPIAELDLDWTNGMTPSCFRIARSRTNFDVDTHSDPGWNTNIDVETFELTREIPDCPADFDGNDVVDINDLLGFLANWFAGTVEADYALDGEIDINDLLAFLSAWFAGC